MNPMDHCLVSRAERRRPSGHDAGQVDVNLSQDIDTSGRVIHGRHGHRTPFRQAVVDLYREGLQIGDPEAVRGTPPRALNDSGGQDHERDQYGASDCWPQSPTRWQRGRLHVHEGINRHAPEPALGSFVRSAEVPFGR